VARALRFQAHLSLFFWGNCKLTVVHLINCIPTLHLSNKSPYEILFSITPTYSIPISTYLDVYVMQSNFIHIQPHFTTYAHFFSFFILVINHYAYCHVPSILWIASLFGNHNFKNKYDYVFTFFKNKSYSIQLFLILSHKVKL
jgi:hypothetical protein